jgi:hypothetical protein
MCRTRRRAKSFQPTALSLPFINLVGDGDVNYSLTFMISFGNHQFSYLRNLHAL